MHVQLHAVLLSTFSTCNFFICNLQGDTGAYRSRAGVGIGNAFGRNTSGGSNLPSCRSSYSGVGSSSVRAAAKERAFPSFGSTFLKKDKLEEKSTYKYSCKKTTL